MNGRRCSPLRGNWRKLLWLTPLVGLTLIWVLWPSAVLASAPQPIGSGPPASAFAPISNPATPETIEIANTFWIIFGLSMFILATVLFGLGAAFFRFTAKPGDPEPRQVHGNRRIEITWVTVPFVILTIAFAITAKVIYDVNQGPTQSASAMPVVNIQAIGHRWWWEFRYPNENVVTANELHVPVNTLVAVDVLSDDVIHSFWIPQLTRQMDATPNNSHFVYFRADSTGIYPGACYEYCGGDHAWMQFRAVVDTPAGYRAWISREQRPAPPPTGTLAQAGEGIFSTLTCASCHTVQETPANGIVGPNLSHVASRWGIAGGVLPMSQQNLALWIRNPDNYKPGVLMPAFPLSKHDVNALAAYLYTLK